ncbi:MAG TPA: DoxX family protein [Blastocatellia bacterium]|nr:DoxX family protein [Blastocatellia bacterium]
MLQKLIATNKDNISIILRLTLGAVMFPHGAQKVLGWFGGGGFKATLQGMTGMGLPAAIVVTVMIAEFLGSLGLIFGFLTRLSALGILSVMLGAIFTVHQQYGFFMNWMGKQAGEGFEYHLLAIAIAIALLIRGGGAFSIDRALENPRR